MTKCVEKIRSYLSGLQPSTNNLVSIRQSPTELLPTNVTMLSESFENTLYRIVIYTSFFRNLSNWLFENFSRVYDFYSQRVWDERIVQLLAKSSLLERGCLHSSYVKVQSFQIVSWLLLALKLIWNHVGLSQLLSQSGLHRQNR